MNNLIVEALDVSDKLRELVASILAKAEDTKGAEEVVTLINESAKKFVALNIALEDIQSAIEDIA